tara:strand:- start:478 stop:1089 length:612 start_codon:yes stop_codon:yes gene_type:complete
MGAPRGLILFSKTPVSIDANSSTKQQLILIAGLLLSSLIAAIWIIEFILAAPFLLLLSILLQRQIRETTSIPLAVNLNHPFMETSAVADSEIMVKFSDEWINPGIHRLKLAKDPLAGWVIHKQNTSLSILSTWSINKNEAILLKQLAIINQAISLNNAINESIDEFEDARERESQESTLLEREWLPEDELEIQGPISRLFSPE